MGLLDSLRNAEQKRMSSVRKRVERAKDGLVDVERRIRQRMRIYPQKLRSRMGIRSAPEQEPEILDSSMAAGAAGANANLSETPASEVPKPIISINGQDIEAEEVKEKDLDHHAA